MSKLTETGALCYLKIIKRWCESQNSCYKCPFIVNGNGCSFPKVPFTWDLTSILIAPPYEWEVGDDTEEEEDEGETFEDEDASLIEDILSEDDDIEKSQ